MYRLRINGTDNTNQYEELVKEFLSPGQYIINGEDGPVELEYFFEGDKNALKRKIYADLSHLTGTAPGWGILTGIRPVKLAGELLDRGDDPSARLREDFLLNSDKTGLVTEILDYQRKQTGRPPDNSMSIYLGIPFCPTRCLYCSFTSNQVDDREIERYLGALHHEIEMCGEMAAHKGLHIESVYFGGGTPTTLSAEQLYKLLVHMSDAFPLSKVKEYTVEAGRPDTITAEKLVALKDNGIDRISINPQSMKQATLETIGRAHTVEDVYRAFELARKCGMATVNTDLIAGLPGEGLEDFKNSLKEIVRLGAENITLHTLAVKRASRLKELDEVFNYKNENICEDMLTWGHEFLRRNEYRPYYLYRQKHTSGNTENTGFCTKNKASVYNIRIMEEAQSILALGAGGISKVYFPAENRLERVPNVSNYQIYIERIDEMIERKRRGFFI